MIISGIENYSTKTIKARAAAQPSQSVSSSALVVYTSLCYNLIKLNLQLLLELLHTCVVVIYNRSISLLKKYTKSNRFVSFTTLLKSDKEIVTHG